MSSSSRSTRAPMPTSTLAEMLGDMVPLMKRIREGDMLTRDDLMGWMVLGPPGSGKTRTVESKFKFSVIITMPEELADNAAILMAVGDSAKYLVHPKVEAIVKWALAHPMVPCALILDELPLGEIQLNKIVANWYSERVVAGTPLPDNVVIIATGNQRKHQCGVGSLPANLVSRMRIYEIGFDVAGWLDWGAATLHPDVLAYAHMKPTAMYCWSDDPSETNMGQQYMDAARDKIPYPNFRSNTALSNALKSSPNLSLAGIAAFIGPERAAEFQAMRRLRIPTHEDLLEGRAEMPLEPMACWVAVIRCGQLLTPGNAAKTARCMRDLNPELVEVGLKIAGKTALAFLKARGIRVANGHLALVKRDEGAYWFPGFADELLCEGSRYLAMQEAE